MNFRDLARLMRQRQIMTVEDAATYLGIKKVSLETAAARRRIGYVQVGYKKLFTKDDLDLYAERSAKGRDSQLVDVAPEIIPPLDEEELVSLM